MRDRLILVGLAVNEVLWRLASDLPELLSYLQNENLLTAATSFLSIYSSEVRTVSEISGLIFFFYTIYTFIPQLYPNRFSKVTSRRGFRVLFASISIGIAVSVSKAISAARGEGAFRELSLVESGILLFAATATASLFVMAAYYGYLRRSIDLNNHILDIVKLRFQDEELEEFKEKSGRDRKVNQYMAFSVFYFPSAMLLGMVTYIAGLLFPIPEFLALGLVASVYLEPVTRRVQTPFSKTEADVEANLPELIKNTYKTPKGVFTVLLAIAGFGFGVATFNIASSDFLTDITEGLAQLLNVQVTQGLIKTARGGSFFFAGGYIVWFWYREFRRVPHFLYWWEGKYAESRNMKQKYLPELPTRPPDALLIPAAFVALTSSRIVLQSYFEYGEGRNSTTFGIETSSMVDFIYLIGVLILSVALIWSIRKSLKMEPQHPSSEQYIIPICFSAFPASIIIPVLVGLSLSTTAPILGGIKGVRIILFIPLTMIPLYFLMEMDLRLKKRFGEYNSVALNSVASAYAFALSFVVPEGLVTNVLMLCSGAMAINIVISYLSLKGWTLRK